MCRIHLPGDLVEPLGPGGSQLAVEEPLGSLDVLDPDETVFLLAVADAGPVKRSRQPLPAIHPDLHGERKPGLDAGMHQTELRVQPVVIMMQALAQTRLQLQVFRLRIAVDLERGARLDTSQHTNQSLGNTVPGRDAPGHTLLGRLGRRQVAYFPARRLRHLARSRLDPLGHRLRMSPERFEQDSRLRQVTPHPFHVADLPQ